MKLSPDELDQLYDATVFDRDGEKVGTVGQIYLDDATEEPNFVTVRTGLFGTKETFVPVRDADFSDGDVHLPYDREVIRECPAVESDSHLDEPEQAELFRHYGLDPHATPAAPTADADSGSGTDEPAGDAG